jgi:hypothetical protein
MLYLTMDLPEQPPPDAPAPPPGPEAIRSRRVMRRILVVGILSIGILLAGLAFFMGGRYRRATLTETISHMRSLHLAFLDFATDYGSFPDASTIADVKVATSTSLALGTSSSNEMFRQMIATTVKAESPFWAKSSISPHKPDNNIGGSHALEKGECGFAYVTGTSASSSTLRPILLAPVDPVKRCFERRWDYSNMAVVLFLGGSVRTFPIDRHGRVEIGGMDFFDPRQAHWGGTAPDVKWPE